MDDNLYSSALEKYPGSLSSEIITAIEAIRKFLNIEDQFIIYKYNEERIAICIEIGIQLPSLGPVNDIDIRKNEPILIIFNLLEFPFKAPRITSNRKDFPHNKLPHLYAKRKNKPSIFCLSRGSIDDWYATKRIESIVIRARNWLKDAAAGFLIEDNEQFDPVRLENYFGIFTYSYDKLANIILENKSNSSVDGMITIFLNTPLTEKNFSYKFLLDLQESLIEKSLELAVSFNSLKNEIKEKYLFGILLWSKDELTYDDYDAELPENYEELIKFCFKYNIDVEKSVAQYISKGLQLLYGIPVIVTIRRPKKLIGYSNCLEFFHFTVLADEGKVNDKIIDKSASVKILAHREELTLEKANKISGAEIKIPKIISLGCGALGSIITTMIARNGFKNFVLVDNEKVEPHNLVRHALYSGSIGINKAKALGDEIKKLYVSNDEEIHVIESNILNIETYNEIKKHFENGTILLDTTASNSISFYLTKIEIPDQVKLIKCELSYKGNLGVLFLEGVNRNPRIDDLSILCYSLYSEIPQISDWLKYEKESIDSKTEDLIVGIGCNSETMILPNEVIYLHASIFTNYIKDLNPSKNFQGEIILSQLSNTLVPKHNINRIIVKPFLILNCANKSGWEIRLKDGISKLLFSRLNQYTPRETGGVLIGIVNYKTKVIHVIEILDAPRDSKFFRNRFIRGVEKLNEKIEEIKHNSGQIIGYIGEWHTHPMNLKEYSNVDYATIMRFKNIFDNLPDPIPVFILIVTPSELIPFVFSN